MNTFDNLFSRRSIRAYNGESITEAELNLPEGMIPCCAIILGHTDEKYTPRDIPENKIKTDFMK